LMSGTRKSSDSSFPSISHRFSPMDASTQTWAIERVGQIAINVHDVDRATRFYRDVLGLKFLFAAPPGLAFFDCGGMRLMLTAPESLEHDQRSSVIYYVVPNIAQAYSSLTERGVVFEDKPHVVARLEKVEIWMAFLKDPDGNLLALMCEKSV
jgi:methylmalonyl-CoA/ethylmalonyl-CoA epimerase